MKLYEYFLRKKMNNSSYALLKKSNESLAL